MRTSAALTLTCLFSLGALSATSCAPSRVPGVDDEEDLAAPDMASAGPWDLARPCVGLACQRPKCNGTNTTTLG